MAGLASVKQVVDSSQAMENSYSYEAFGQPTVGQSDVANPYLFVGGYGVQWESAPSLYFMQARYYGPGVGRFLSEDPYGGSPQDPMSLHKYLYCGNGPVSRADASGLTSFLRDVGATFGLSALGTGLSWIGGAIGGWVWYGGLIGGCLAVGLPIISMYRDCIRRERENEEIYKGPAGDKVRAARMRFIEAGSIGKNDPTLRELQFGTDCCSIWTPYIEACGVAIFTALLGGGYGYLYPEVKESLRWQNLPL